MDLDFAVGDWVVVSLDGGPTGLGDGEVHSVGKDEIVVKTSGPLPTELRRRQPAVGSGVPGKPGADGCVVQLWRLDRTEGNSPVRLAKENLVRLLLGPVVQPTTVVHEGASAEFAVTTVPGDVARQRLLIGMQAPTFATECAFPWSSRGSHTVADVEADRLRKEFMSLNSDQVCVVLIVVRLPLVCWLHCTCCVRDVLCSKPLWRRCCLRTTTCVCWGCPALARPQRSPSSHAASLPSERAC
jgi:hypothetical protein